MGYIVIDIKKNNASYNGALGHHIDRDMEHTYSFEHADLTRIHLNEQYYLNDYCRMPYNEAINNRIKDGYQKSTTIRKDAVKSVNLILSGTHEDMCRIFSDKEEREAWIQANIDFVRDKFGQDNIIRFTLHMDEKTPHIHCCFVPLIDGALSAKKIIGNKHNIQRLHTDYATAMRPFGLTRGRMNLHEKKITPQEYRRSIEEQTLDIKKIVNISLSSILKPKKAAEKRHDLITKIAEDLEFIKQEKERIRREYEYIKEENERFSEEREKIEESRRLYAEINDAQYRKNLSKERDLKEKEQNIDNKIYIKAKEMAIDLYSKRDNELKNKYKEKEDDLNKKEKQLNERESKCREVESKEFIQNLLYREDELKIKENQLNKQKEELEKKGNEIREADKILAKNVATYNARVNEMNQELEKRKRLGFRR